MRKAACLTVFVLVIALLMGCGGALGRNSAVQVRLESTAMTVSMDNMHLVVSPNGGADNSVAAASDTQTQVWAIVTNSSALREIDFTTTSQRVPFIVYVQNAAALQEHARLRIFMDGFVVVDTTLTLAATSSIKEATVFRNHAHQP